MTCSSFSFVDVAGILFFEKWILQEVDRLLTLESIAISEGTVELIIIVLGSVVAYLIL
jgi:hypothetical protein